MESVGKGKNIIYMLNTYYNKAESQLPKCENDLSHVPVSCDNLIVFHVIKQMLKSLWCCVLRLI